MRKPIILIAVFLLPIGVFIFLRYFGRNEFDIPVFYKDKIDKPTGCDLSYAVPYLVPDSLSRIFNPNQRKAVLILDSAVTEKELSVVLEDFNKEELVVYPLSESKMAKLKWVKECVLFMSGKQTAVLIDGENQIRGYFYLPARDEMDKLDVELKVLLKKY